MVLRVSGGSTAPARKGMAQFGGYGSMKKFLIVAALAGAMLQASAAQAVLTLTQTLSFSTVALDPATTGSETLSFNQFDTLSGRYQLTGVTVSYAPLTTALSDVIITSNSGNRRTYAATIGGTNTLSSSAFTSITGTFTGTSAAADFITGLGGGEANGLSRTVAIGYTATSGFTSPTITDYSAYLGTGTIAVTNTLSNITRAITTTGGQGNATVTSAEVGGTFSVVYSYIDLLPDPGTWMTMILGFGFVGAAMRRRRAQASLAA